MNGNLLYRRYFFFAIDWIEGNRWKSLDIVQFLSFFFGAGNKSSYNATTNKLLSVNFISFVTILILCHEYHALALTPFRLHHPQQPSLIQKVHHAVTRSIWFRLCAPKKVSGIYLLQSKIFIVVKVDK